MLRWLAVGVVLTLVVMGCGTSDSPKGQRLDAGGESWRAIERTLPDRANPTSSNVCGRGAPGCLRKVTTEMSRRLERLAASCDHDAAFALMYLRVTEGVAAPGVAARFRDRRYLNHLDAVFAALYFRAFDAWRDGRQNQVPEAWRIAFDAADERKVAGIGDMLLGMNAHISRDLPFALATTGLKTPDGESGKPDFARVDSLLESVEEPILREAARRFDPGIASSTLPLAGSVPLNVAELIASWRTEAWQNGERLIASRSWGSRAGTARRIETAAAGRARMLVALTSNLVIGPSPAVRLRHCGARHRG